MTSLSDALSDTVGNVVTAVIMVIMSVLSFFFVVFVVKNGSSLAGYTPSGDFVVLSTAIVVAAAILSGVLHNQS